MFSSSSKKKAKSVAILPPNFLDIENTSPLQKMIKLKKHKFI